MSGGTLFSSEYCPGGHYSLVNIVRGDNIHRGTSFTPTPVVVAPLLLCVSGSSRRCTVSANVGVRVR